MAFRAGCVSESEEAWRRPFGAARGRGYTVFRAGCVSGDEKAWRRPFGASRGRECTVFRAGRVSGSEKAWRRPFGAFRGRECTVLRTGFVSSSKHAWRRHFGAFRGRECTEFCAESVPHGEGAPDCLGAPNIPSGCLRCTKKRVLGARSLSVRQSTRYEQSHREPHNTEHGNHVFRRH